MSSFDEVVNSPSSGRGGSSAISGTAAESDKNAAARGKVGKEKKRLIFIIIWKVGDGVNHVKFLRNFYQLSPIRHSPDFLPSVYISVSALTATPRIRRRKPAVPTPLSSADDKKFRTKISVFPALAAEPLRPRAATPEIATPSISRKKNAPAQTGAFLIKPIYIKLNPNALFSFPTRGKRERERAKYRRNRRGLRDGGQHELAYSGSVVPLVSPHALQQIALAVVGCQLHIRFIR